MNIRQRGTRRHRYPARDPVAQAGMEIPSMKASLARSAAANQVAARSVRPRMGRPASTTVSRLKPRLRPTMTST